MTEPINTDKPPRYRSTPPSPPTEIVTLSSPAAPGSVSDFEDIFKMSPLNTDAETETDINAALLTMSFEVPLGPLSGYGSAPKPAPKYKKPAAKLTKPISEQPDYAYLFKGYDADALVLTDQQINSPGQAVDGKQHHAEPLGQSPLYGETDSDDGDPFIYDRITFLPSSYHNTLDEDVPPSVNNSFGYGSTFNSEPPSSPSSAANGLDSGDEADSEDNNDDDNDSHDSNDDADDDDNDSSDADDDNDNEDKEGEEEQNNNDFYNPEDYFTDNNNYNYSDNNESGDSPSRCSNLSTHPLLRPPPIYAIAPELMYQTPPTAPTMLPPAPPPTPLALPSNAPPIIIPFIIPPNIQFNNPRSSDLETLETPNRAV
ncbi:hypothetical protein COCVIDRAFT_35983 [Bipolaris victoriae FI3]|uniref:Uncharacterized protein n=1 Tax=Bipolaris victoriae (strain FI3) TaxID=930091 RepID=W7EEY8_BIPV3|nr:hypothetical protein COCVIDRAFT_35983 [Bipolaris victoriae FI3]